MTNATEDTPHSIANVKKKSLTQKYFLWLQPCEIWCLMRKKTSYGSTLYDCIRSALENTDVHCGLYAFDADCYEIFRCLFWPVIMDYHKVDVRTLTFKHDFGDFNDIHDLSTQLNDMIISTEVRVSRSIQGYPMGPKMTSEQRFELEERIRNALERLENDLQGEYHSLKDMNEAEPTRFREKNLLFQAPIDPHLESAGAYNQWPDGRGIYVNKDENFVVWVNEEDHISVISRANHANMREIYERLVRAMNTINQQLEFIQHQHLGFLNFSPTNIGTAFRASVRARLSHLEKTDDLTEMSKKFDIQVQRLGDENIYDLSNAIRLGRSEFQLIRGMWDGIRQILEREEVNGQ